MGHLAENEAARESAAGQPRSCSVASQLSALCRSTGEVLCSKEIKALANPTVRIYFICMQIY